MRCVSREIYRYIRPGAAPSRNPYSQRCSVEALLSYPQLLHALSHATRRAQGQKIRPFVNLWQGVFDAVGLNTNNYLTKPPGTITDPQANVIYPSPTTQQAPAVGLPLSQPPDVHVHVGMHHWIGGLMPTELFPPVAEEEDDPLE